MLKLEDSLPTLAEPRTFAGLMELYESNYERLRRLIPEVPGQRRRVSRIPGALDLHLEILEHHRYTTDLWLSYLFEDAGRGIAEPAVEIRLYHDARQAEALACSRRHEPAASDRALESKWEINRFLNKWLGYCLSQGHRFARRDGLSRATDEPLLSTI
ncbi:MAG: DUF1249 domain-containing protein [Gammaproteobacteria bacterium]|nr:DUF1249 domain-containing protein [Gammaproteobacteria bacterium]